MNCKDYEPLIYLYEELTVSEKEKVELHLQHCGSCKKLLDRVRQQQQVLKELASIKAAPKDPGKLTHNIMRALEPKSKPSWPELLAAYVDALWMRSALGAASVCLVVFFLVEQQKSPIVAFSKSLSSGEGFRVRLNISKFLEAHRNRGNTKARTENTSLYACLKLKHCDNLRIKNFKQKKSNERI